MTPKKLSNKSVDGSQLNLEALYAIAPSCFTEVHDPQTGETKHVVNFTTLRTLLGDDAVEGEHERYQFTWPGKQAARLEAATETTETLRFVPQDSLYWDKTENIYIEGDNLRVLKLLQKSYLGKVKMIYIDPPYNTGKDFVYHDNFSRSATEENLAADNIDEEGNRFRVNPNTNGRFHSDWCSMMLSRLLVAHRLLADNGVIFISIDDKEVHNLRKICDEVFGEKNFKSLSIVMNNRGGRDYGGIALQHDYLLIYGKSESAMLNLIEEKDKQFQYVDGEGGFNLMELRNRNVKFNYNNRPNLYYPFYVNPEKVDNNGLMELSLEPTTGFIEVYPTKSQGIQTVWRWGKEEKARSALNKEIFGKANKNGGYMIVQKYRKETKMQRSIWDEKEFVNERGTEAIKEFFGAAFFDYPKSPYTIKRVLELGTSPDALILDFFSGSATTAHAVMQLNAEDLKAGKEGKRKYICVQLAEEIPKESEARKAGYTTIPEIAKERIRQAGKKILAENSEVADRLDMGFRVFKLDSSNYEEVSKTPGEYDQAQLDLFLDNIKTDRTELDLLFGAMLSWGVPLSLSQPLQTEVVDDCTIYNVTDGQLVACFAKEVTEAVVRTMAAMKPERVLFRDSCFAEDKMKINLFELFKQQLDWDEREALDNIRVI